MWAQIITVIVFGIVVPIKIAANDIELPTGPAGIHRLVSEGVKSVGYKVVYGDEDMAMINEVVNDVEDSNILKQTINLNEAISPLPAQDVKCLMSVDRYCSKEMMEIKGVLIQAIKEDCVKCSIQEKDKVGKVIASMMAHDPVAWKLFLTRCALQIKKPKQAPKMEQYKLREVGEPEEVFRSPQNRYELPGVKVRVKRYTSVLIPQNSTQ